MNNIIAKQFLRCTNIKEISFKENLPKLSWNEQQEFLKQTVLHPVVLRFPLKLSYQASFLKLFINHFENETVEIHDDIYSTYCNLMMSTTNDDDYCYKHYKISEDDSCIVSVKESSNMISKGTTGLRTWEASFVLSEWCLQNDILYKDKVILELGSGAGLAGLVVSKCCQPRQIWLTDCHTSVLTLLTENVKLNCPPCQINNDRNNDTDKKEKMIDDRIHFISEMSSNSDIGVVNLDWEDLKDGALIVNDIVPDLIIAADVVYDSSVFKPLCNAIDYFLKRNKNCKVILVCTVRNEKTIKEFVNLLESKDVTLSELQQPKPKTFSWPGSVHVKLFEICNNR